MKKKFKTGVGTEPWYKSRRVWSSGLTLFAVICLAIIPDKQFLIEGIAMMIASVLGLSSWIFPKA